MNPAGLQAKKEAHPLPISPNTVNIQVESSPSCLEIHQQQDWTLLFNLWIDTNGQITDPAGGIMPEVGKMWLMQKKQWVGESSVPPFLAQSLFPGQEAKLFGNRSCLSRAQILLPAKSCRQWQKPRAESAFLRPPGSHARSYQLQM